MNEPDITAEGIQWKALGMRPAATTQERSLPHSTGKPACTSEDFTRQGQATVWWPQALWIHLKRHKMEKTELPASSQSPAFSQLSQLLSLAFKIFHIYNHSLQEDQFFKKTAGKKLNDFLGLWRVYLLKSDAAWANKSMVTAAQDSATVKYPSIGQMPLKGFTACARCRCCSDDTQSSSQPA